MAWRQGPTRLDCHVPASRGASYRARARVFDRIAAVYHAGAELEKSLYDPGNIASYVARAQDVYGVYVASAPGSHAWKREDLRLRSFAE